MEEDTRDETEVGEQVATKKRKHTETGVIYLSRIPSKMNVKIIRQKFQTFGELGRIFLQPDRRGRRGPNKFAEGWVEFMNKKAAKQVAQSLNNTQIGGRKRHKWYDELWNIKYLSKFKWAHLNERLAYEKAVHSQRMRTEISQAKREANFHIENAEKRERLAKKLAKKRKVADGEEPEAEKSEGGKMNKISLRETEDEIVNKKQKYLDRRKSVREKKKDKSSTVPKESKAPKNSFLSKIFSS